jgi:hypothetical protein
MSVINVLRRARIAALPAVAGLAAAGLAVAPAAQAASPVPARPAAAGLQVTGTIDLGRLGPGFSNVLGEAPDGDVYYAVGSVVYQVRGDHAPVAVLQASAPVLAVAATSADLLVDDGHTVSAYSVDDGRLRGTWTLAPSPATVTSAGLYPVGSTVWAYTGATTEGQSQHANVYRFDLSSPAVQVVSTDGPYPGSMAADSAGLYAEELGASGDYLVLYPPSGPSRRHLEAHRDVPLALAAGNVYLLGHDEFPAPDTGNYLDAYDGSTLGHLFAYHLADSDTDITGTRIGLLMLGAGTVSLLDPVNGQLVAALRLPGAVALVPGPSAAVLVVSGSRTHLLRLDRGR